MDAHSWHRWARAAAAPLPEPFTQDELDRLGDDELADYVDRLDAAFEGLVIDVAATRGVESGLDRVLRRSLRQPPGARVMAMLDAPFSAGKSTLVMRWAQRHHRRLLGDAVDQARPSWSPEPGVQADWVPVVYATLRSASKVKELNTQILEFLRYPTSRLTRGTTTTKVIQAFATHQVRLLVIDDVHFLKTNSGDGRETLDYLKFLNTEVGLQGGAMVLVGADLQDGPIHTDPQLAGRLSRLTLSPCMTDSLEAKAAWQELLVAIESVLLPYLPSEARAATPPFSRIYPAYIWRRTQGYVGDTVDLLGGAVKAAIEERAPRIDRRHLAEVMLTERAAAGEADLMRRHRARCKRRSEL